MLLTKYLLTEPLGKDKAIMLNSLSGAVDFVEKKTHESLLSNRLDEIPGNIIKVLTDRGYLFKDRQEELVLLNKINSKYNIEDKENYTNFVICPTFDCNLACSYCFQNNLEQRKIYLTSFSLKNLYSAINKFSSKIPGKKGIQLFGGEPLLPKNKQFVEEIFKYAYLKELPVAITTNGTTLVQYKKLIEQYKSVIKVTQITIDGPPEIHNKRRVTKKLKPTLSLIIEGINFLLNNGIGVQARVNIDKSNIEYLPKLANYLKEKGLFKRRGFKCSLAPVADHCAESISGNLLDEVELLKNVENMAARFSEINNFSLERIPKLIKHLYSVMNGSYSGPSFKYCQANKNSFIVFAADGLIYLCSEAAGHKELAVGRFLPDFKLNEDKLNQWYNRSILTIKKCRDCKIAPLCGGGCTFAAYSVNKDVSKPYCCNALEVIKKYLNANKEMLFKKAIKEKVA